MRELRPVADGPVAGVAERARTYFRTEATLPIEKRIERLKALDASIRVFETRIFDALKQDLGKPLHEAYPAEVGLVYDELKHTISSLKRWAKPTKVSSPVVLWPVSAYRQPEPLGTALIISPWNYPFQLAISPLVGAIGAGCNVVMKPSELSPATSAVMAECLTAAFGDDGFVQVVQGDAEVSKALLAEKWDIIFFTGSTRVGQVVMEAAAKHLTPVVLELGGKSPTIIDEQVDLDIAARRVAWGKFYNAGQTCIAPDYVLVHKNVKSAFVDALGKTIREFFGENPQASADYARIISSRHFDRLLTLMKGGTVAHGGQSDAASKYIAPTILTDVKLTSQLMQEEIFGPLLPILEVESIEAAIQFVKDRPKPLALYVFSKDSAKTDEVLRRVSAGGAVANDCIIHVATHTLPFGGVGDSGMGAYHGKYSFDAFSHYKSVMKKPWVFDLKVRYPPYKTPLAVLKKLIG